MTEKKDREYSVRRSLNGRIFLRVVIDPHYEESHSESISDQIILDLLEQIDGQDFSPKSVSESGIEYYSIEIVHEDKGFRMILCHETESTELIIINCYRDRRINAT